MPDALQGAVQAAMPYSKRFLACMPFILEEAGTDPAQE